MTNEEKQEKKREHQKNWRRRHPEIWHRQKARYYAKHRRRRPNSKAIWEDDHIKTILVHPKPDSELAKALGRSVEAVQVMRSKVKKRRIEQKRRRRNTQ